MDMLLTWGDSAESEPAYFTAGGDPEDPAGTFLPTPAAGGHWGADLISGPAVAGLAAWALERDFGDPAFTPARFTIDLLAPARQRPTSVATRSIREGRRVRYAECEVSQGDRLVARATSVQYLKSEAPPGTVWTKEPAFYPPRAADADALFVGSDAAGWSEAGADHQNTSRKRAYYRGVDVVAGHPASPFVRAVVVAEAATNLVVNLGTDGIGYINGDLTVRLARLPRGDYVGEQADARFESDGIATGSATLFDAEGAFGTASVTAIANPRAQIDFAGAARTEAPGAELFDRSARSEEPGR